MLVLQAHPLCCALTAWPIFPFLPFPPRPLALSPHGCALPLGALPAHGACWT